MPDFIDDVRIASPCPTSWDRMAGDDRVRHCTLCDLNVYNFAEMTRAEIGELLMRTEGRLCVRLHRRADGTLLTRDCPSAMQKVRRRMSRFGSAVMAAAFGIAALASGCATRAHGRQSKVHLEIERVLTAQTARFAGVVLSGGNPLPGVTVVVRGTNVPKEIAVVTGVDGKFALPSLPYGVYRVEVMLDGFEPAIIEQLQLNEGEATRAWIGMHLDGTIEEITVGCSGPEPMRDGVSTTFSQDLINKLPM
jgi:hypothetical protein